MILTDLEIRALNAIRRSPHAATLRSIAVKTAARARERYETTPSTEENRLQAAAANDVVARLFDEAV
jgi:hypothetical protein